MKFTTVLGPAFFAAAAFAAPKPEPVNTFPGQGKLNFTSSPADNIISERFAGAALLPKEGKNLIGVGGTIVAPSIGGGYPEDVAVAVWIGIDGLSNERVAQTGIDVVKKTDGTMKYDAWFEWYPNPLTYIPDTEFPIQEGDTIIMDLAIKGAGTMATATLENTRTGKTVTRDFVTPSEDDDVLGTDANWVIEQPPKFELGDFGTLDFTSSYAVEGGSNAKLGLDDAKGITLKQGDNVRAIGSVPASDVVHIVYQVCESRCLD